jgi:hypothetical protein
MVEMDSSGSAAKAFIALVFVGLLVAFCVGVVRHDRQSRAAPAPSLAGASARR